MELTILMPCLNEAETLARCIESARLGIQRAGVRGEILIADNGSTDGSQAIAEKPGARVVPVKEKGYGSALRGGIQAASGKWILMGDADDSYDFSEADRFVKKFQEGFELVMGCRLPVGGGTILPGAMPWKNRWLGNPVLSFIGRLFFKCPAHDFHSGLRGFTRAAFEKMDLQTTGMEFASEMVIKSTLEAVENHRGARHAAPGRAVAPAALEAVARRLAAPAVHAAVLAALAVSRAGNFSLGARHYFGRRAFGSKPGQLAESI